MSTFIMIFIYVIAPICTIIFTLLYKFIEYNGYSGIPIEVHYSQYFVLFLYASCVIAIMMLVEASRFVKDSSPYNPFAWYRLGLLCLWVVMTAINIKVIFF